MLNKNIVKIINEEISNGFDFLSMDEISEERNHIGILNSKEFQTALINDLTIRNSPNIIDWKSDLSTSNTDDIDLRYPESPQGIEFEYNVHFIYIFNEKRYPLNLYFEGNDIDYKTQGEYTTNSQMSPAEYPEIVSVDYSNMKILLFDGEGNEIDISWIDQNTQLKNKIGYVMFGTTP